VRRGRALSPGTRTSTSASAEGRTPERACRALKSETRKIDQNRSISINQEFPEIFGTCGLLLENSPALPVIRPAPRPVCSPLIHASGDRPAECPSLWCPFLPRCVLEFSPFKPFIFPRPIGGIPPWVKPRRSLSTSVQPSVEARILGNNDDIGRLRPWAHPTRPRECQAGRSQLEGEVSAGGAKIRELEVIIDISPRMEGLLGFRVGCPGGNGILEWPFGIQFPLFKQPYGKCQW
jgi:hypothetical protein